MFEKRNSSDAQERAKKKEYQKELKYWDEVLQPGAINVSGLLARARVKENLGQFESALKDYSWALGLEPANTSIWSYRADIKLRLKLYGEVAQDCAEALKRDLSNVTAWLYSGLLHYELNCFEDAIRACTQALELQPTNIRALNCRAQSLRAVGKHEEWVEDFKKSIALERQNRATKSGLPKVEQQMEKMQSPPKATTVEKVSGKPTSLSSPKGLRAVENKSVLTRAAHDEKQMDIILVQAIEHSEKKEYSEVIFCCDSALCINPEDVDVLRLRGETYQKLGQVREAVQDYQKALGLSPQDEDLKKRLRVAQQQMEEQLNKKSEKSFDNNVSELKTGTPKNSPIQWRRVVAAPQSPVVPEVFAREEDIEIVKGDLEDTGTLEFPHAPPEKKWLTVQDLLLDDEDTGVSLPSHSEQAAEESELVVLRTKAKLLLLQKKYDQAIVYCDQILKKDPKDEVALKLRGSANVELGNLHEALRDLQNANMLEPDDTDIEKELEAVKKQIEETERNDHAKRIEKSAEPSVKALGKIGSNRKESISSKLRPALPPRPHASHAGVSKVSNSLDHARGRHRSDTPIPHITVIPEASLPLVVEEKDVSLPQVSGFQPHMENAQKNSSEEETADKTMLTRLTRTPYYNANDTDSSTDATSKTADKAYKIRDRLEERRKERVVEDVVPKSETPVSNTTAVSEPSLPVVVEQKALPALSPAIPKDLEISLDKLTFKEVIGSGGFGIVRKGKHEVNTREKKDVAIKEIKSDSMTEKDFRDFEKEVEIHSNLINPGIVKLRGYINSQGRFGLVMPFMDQGSLRNVLDNNNSKQLSWKKKVKMILNAARGLFYLHNRADPKVVHGDIKSPNILVDKHGKAKLADFGSAVLERVRRRETLTAARKSGVKPVVFQGSLRWLPPEYLKAEASSTGEAIVEKTSAGDIYSLGVVFRELESHRHPYASESDNTVVRDKIIAGECDEFTEEKAPQEKAPQELKDLTRKCWKGNPGERPLAQEVVSGLEKVYDTLTMFKSSSRRTGTIGNGYRGSTKYTNDVQSQEFSATRSSRASVIYVGK